MLASLTCLLALAISSRAADLSPLLAKVKAAGPEAAGSVEAAAAWKVLSQQGPEAIIPLLEALDGANPVASNWLHSALSAVVERVGKENNKLPIKDIEQFLSETRHAGNARRLAFELVCQANATARDRWLPQLLDDPALELRFDAVQSAFDKAKAASKDDPKAKAEINKLLGHARHFGQTDAIAKELAARGEKVNLTEHYGFFTRWQILGPFDNPEGKGFDKPLPPEVKIDLKGDYLGKVGRIRWQSVTTTEQNGIVDLNKVLPKPKGADANPEPKAKAAASGSSGAAGENFKNVTAYALCEVDSPVEREVEFRAASATGIKLWVNGQEVLARESYHQGMEPDSHAATGTLKKGRNVLLLKICQNDQKEPWAQEWRFQLRITDRLGARIPVAEVTPN